MTTKVKNLLHVNQFVLNTQKATYFQSYESVVAKLNYIDGMLYVSLNWNYSHTTTRHLYEFIRQYARNYVEFTNAKAMRKAISQGKVKLVKTHSLEVK